MSEYVDCRDCNTECVRADGSYGYTFCSCFNPKKKPMTNADRIRAMSDEELAEAISYIPMCVGTDDDKDCEKDGCKGCFLKWLQQPAED